VSIYKILIDWFHEIDKLMDLKRRYVFNWKTLWQIDFVIPRSSVLFIALLSKFKPNIIKIKKQSNMIESFSKIKKVDDLNNWQIDDVIASSGSGIDLETTIRTIINIASNFGANSISVLSGSDKLSEQVKSLGFSTIQTSKLYYAQDFNVNNKSGLTGNLIREKKPSDEYNIFQLYKLKASQTSHMVHTLKFELWKSLMIGSSKFKEFVIEERGVLVCWFRIGLDTGFVKVEILSYSSLDHNLINSIFKMILDHKKSSVYLLISNGNKKIENLLLQYGLNMVAEYDLSIKWLAKFLHNDQNIRSRTVKAGYQNTNSLITQN